jgi:hypothetical protein
LLFLLLPATLASLDRMLLDGPLCALFAGFLWYTRMGHHKRLHLVLLLAPLIRETGLLLAAGTSGAQILRKQWRAAIINAAAAVPALCWWVYVRARTSDAPVAPELGRPIIGLIERLFNLQPERYSAKPSLQGIAAVLDLAAIAGFIACLALGMSALWLYRAEWRNPVLLTVSGFVALGLALGQETQLADAYAYSRPLSPLLLWIMLQSVAAGRWTALVPPLLVSAGVGVYLLPPAWSFAKGLLSL